MTSTMQRHICEIAPWLASILSNPKKEKTLPIKRCHTAFLPLIIFMLYLFEELFYSSRI